MKIFLLIVLVVSVYWPSTVNGYIWDDDVHVGAIEKICESGISDGLSMIWLRPGETLDHYAQYYPLLLTSYLVEYFLWGNDPFGYHLVNILLHASVACLAWRVLLLLGVPWAYVVALLFALHPVHVESVTWVTERKNVLSGMFYLLSMLLFLKWREKVDAHQKSNGAYTASLVFFLCALLSKTVTATLPFVLLLLLWWRRKLNKEAFIRLIPFFVTGVVMGCVTILIETGHAGAIGKSWDFNLLERFLIAGRALCFYVSKLLIPHHLTFIYPRWEIDSTNVLQYIYPFVVLALIGGLWCLRHQYGRGPFVGLLIFCGTLFPAIGFLNAYPMLFSFVADHFQYLASIAMLALIVPVIYILVPKVWHRSLIGVMVGVLGCFAVTSRELQAQYLNQETLWRSTIERNPEAWLAHSNLGILEYHAQRYPEALMSLTTAAELNPDHVNTRNHLAVVYLDLAKIKNDVALEKEALKHVNRAIVLGEAERAEYQKILKQQRIAQDHAMSYQVLGDILRHQKKYKEALKQYNQILEFNSRNVTGLNRIGGLYILTKDYGSAIKYLKKSLNINSNQITALTNLGTVFYQQKKYQKAEEVFKKAINMKDVKSSIIPYYYLGMIAKETDNQLQARKYFLYVIKTMPNHELAKRAKQELSQFN